MVSIATLGKFTSPATTAITTNIGGAIAYQKEDKIVVSIRVIGISTKESNISPIKISVKQLGKKK